jgi:hypothetical protein
VADGVHFAQRLVGAPPRPRRHRHATVSPRVADPLRADQDVRARLRACRPDALTPVEAFTTVLNRPRNPGGLVKGFPFNKGVIDPTHRAGAASNPGAELAKPIAENGPLKRFVGGNCQ